MNTLKEQIRIMDFLFYRPKNKNSQILMHMKETIYKEDWFTETRRYKIGCNKLEDI